MKFFSAFQDRVSSVLQFRLVDRPVDRPVDRRPPAVVQPPIAGAWRS